MKSIQFVKIAALLGSVAVGISAQAVGLGGIVGGGGGVSGSLGGRTSFPLSSVAPSSRENLNANTRDLAKSAASSDGAAAGTMRNPDVANVNNNSGGNVNPDLKTSTAKASNSGQANTAAAVGVNDGISGGTAQSTTGIVRGVQDVGQTMKGGATAQAASTRTYASDTVSNTRNATSAASHTGIRNAKDVAGDIRAPQLNSSASANGSASVSGSGSADATYKN
ncbi:MAG: hypothetical protein V4447_07555 [Pseudomonadota bacterium]